MWPVETELETAVAVAEEQRRSMEEVVEDAERRAVQKREKIAEEEQEEARVRFGELEIAGPPVAESAPSRPEARAAGEGGQASSSESAPSRPDEGPPAGERSNAEEPELAVGDDRAAPEVEENKKKQD